ncbi:MAG: carboxypeptidase-like regulatory domain-containing protein [Pedobacter sp.]|nr:MAG: carboxypeptidase-like regulatory domain-containing protein [Pedobacter sp.]
MKPAFFALLIALFTTATFAQNPTAAPAVKKGANRITGKIIDSLTKAPLEYATVALTEATASGTTNSVITDASGNFKFESLATGSYRLAVSYIGYPVKKLNTIVLASGKPLLDLGTIPLAGGARSLQEVQIKK